MRFVIITFVLLFKILACYSADALYILDDNCIEELFYGANNTIQNRNIEIDRDSRGIILRILLQNPTQEYECLSPETTQKLSEIKEFLAKIKNSAIIEVHTEMVEPFKEKELKNWELSSVIASRVEAEILKDSDNIDVSRIKAVGFGEFLPAKNTPYNGGNISNRIDIIILCNVTGE